MQVVEGNIRATGKKIAIVVARFNSFVVESLLEGALDTLDRHGEVNEDDITVVRVPGAYELPIVAKKLAEKKSFDAIIALGAVIRGGTPHFDFVAGECNKGLAQVSLELSLQILLNRLSNVLEPKQVTKAQKLPLVHLKWLTLLMLLKSFKVKNT